MDPQPITYLVDGKSTWNATWQVWIRLAKIVGNSFGMTLEGGYDGICDRNSSFTLTSCALQKTMDYGPQTSLWSHLKSGVTWSFKSHGLMSLMYTCP